MTRLLRRAALCLAIAVTTGGRVAEANATCADLNGDGRVNIADAVALLVADASPPGSPALCNGGGALQCGDLNEDGSISIADVVLLLNSLTGSPTLFPLCAHPDPRPCDANPGTSASAATDGGLHWTGRRHVTGRITTNEVWMSGCRYDLDGWVFVMPGTTLTIEPGAIVAGLDPPTTGESNVSGLVVLRGAKINAHGTPSAPIVMTSSDHLDTGHGGIGDWGGLTINGNAPVNCPGGECLAEGLVGVPFGGPDANDSSGVLEYVRVEFAGKEIAPDDEARLITLNGVGRGTIYDHVQANVGFDSCQTWFGGTVNGKFLVSTGCGNDLFDMQLATQSRIQYAVGAYYEPFMQNLGNESIEWDDNENGFDLLPRTAPILCNVTTVGTNLQPSTGLGRTERAATLRRGTSGHVTNWIAMHFRSAGLNLADNATAKQACDPGPSLKPNGLLVDHTLLFDDGTDTAGGPHFGNVVANWSTTAPPPGGALANCTGPQYWALITASGTVAPTAINSTGSAVDPGVGPDPGIPLKYGLAMPDSQTDLAQFVPSDAAAAGYPLITSLAGNCKAIDPFFDATGYVGAFDPTKASWLTSPWISFELQ